MTETEFFQTLLAESNPFWILILGVAIGICTGIIACVPAMFEKDKQIAALQAGLDALQPNTPDLAALVSVDHDSFQQEVV